MVIWFIEREGHNYKRTTDDGNVDGRALDADVTTPENGPEETGIGGVALLLDLVTAVELCITTGLDTLLDSVVALDRPLVGSAVSSVLAFVANILVTLAVVTGGCNLSGDKRRCRYGEGKSQESDELLCKHVGLESRV